MKKLGRAGSTFGTVIAAAVVISVVGAGGAVAGGLITSKQIKNNTIKSIDVRDGNLTGTDIADGSIKGADIGDGSVGSADLATGSVGKAQIAGAAQGFTSIVTKRVTEAITNGQTLTANVACPAGSVAIGGGGYVAPTGIFLIGSSAGTLVRSLPSTPGGGLTFSFPAGDNDAPTAWRTTVTNDTGADSTAVHYAMCASK